MAKRATKKTRRKKPSGEVVNTYVEPPNVIKVAAHVASLQRSISQDRVEIGKAEKGVEAAQKKLEQAKKQLTTDMLNHTDLVSQMEKAARIQIPVS